MKNLLSGVLILGIALICLSLNSDEILDTYTVIKVDGAITYEKNGKNMNRGDKFASSERLKFKTTASRAAVISKLKGRFVLTPKKSGTSKSNLLPAMSNVSSRKGEILNSIDLKNYFSESILLFKKSEILVKVKEYPQDEQNFFYLMYNHNGESIAKKLSFNGDDVIMERDSIFKVDGVEIEFQTSTAVTLYHRNAATKQSVKINQFNLVVPNENDIVEELSIVKEEGFAKEQFSSSARAYLHEFYGKIDADELKLWLSSKSL
ncbi:MAG: hypothetical protein JKY54_15750 [Flavobacteriales bacterium]|nr:hypothetical protein [Flavobacteriales bacterium]